MKNSIHKPVSRLLWIASLVLVILVIFFLWKENLSIKYKINDQKLANFFTILAATVTAVSIIFIYQQTVQMRQSAEISILPQLYPERIEFYLYSKEGVANGKVITYYVPLSAPGNSTSIVKMPVSNTGNGIANDVEIIWIYHETEMQEFLKGNYYSEPGGLPSTDLPYIKEKDIVLTFLPHDYLQVLGSDNLKADTFNFLVLPGLHLYIKYNDVNGKKHHKMFKVRIYEKESGHFGMHFNQVKSTD